MAFIPYENITYKTDLKLGEVIKKLSDEIEHETERPKIFTFDHLKPYSGTIDGGNFKIRRNLYYQNSFNPIIYGKAYEENDVTKINIKMKMHRIVIIFMSIWLGFTFFQCITFVLASIVEKKFELFNLIPFGMLIFGYLLMTGSFKSESLKVKKHFAKLFEEECSSANV
jgi:hypothetical protein